MSRAKEPHRHSWASPRGDAHGNMVHEEKIGGGYRPEGWVETPHGIVAVGSGRGWAYGPTNERRERVTRLYFHDGRRLHVWSYGRFLSHRGVGIEARKMAREIAS